MRFAIHTISLGLVLFLSSNSFADIDVELKEAIVTGDVARVANRLPQLSVEQINALELGMYRALDFAIARGDQQIATLLVEAGADPFAEYHPIVGALIPHRRLHLAQLLRGDEAHTAIQEPAQADQYLRDRMTELRIQNDFRRAVELVVYLKQCRKIEHENATAQQNAPVQAAAAAAAPVVMEPRNGAVRRALRAASRVFSGSF